MSRREKLSRGIRYPNLRPTEVLFPFIVGSVVIIIISLFFPIVAFIIALIFPYAIFYIIDRNFIKMESGLRVMINQLDTIIVNHHERINSMENTLKSKL